MTNPIQVRRLSNDIRVVIEPMGRKYMISAQQYSPDCPRPWELQPDGWRHTFTVFANTLEGARREFESIVQSEERFLEARYTPLAGRR